jgi:hypothetical protein
MGLPIGEPALALQVFDRRGSAGHYLQMRGNGVVAQGFLKKGGVLGIIFDEKDGRPMFHNDSILLRL